MDFSQIQSQTSLSMKVKRPFLCESEAQPVFKNSRIFRKIVFPRKVLFYPLN